MPSFDAVLEPDLVELRNVVEQARKEIGTRFDFKGSSAAVELAESANKGRDITMFGDSDFQLAQVRDLLLAKAAKRGLDARFLDFSAKPEKLGGDKLKQAVAVKTGIDAESAKKLQGSLKQSKLKVQAQIQGDVLRVSGNKRDELQAAIRLLKTQATDLPLSFTNFRD
jgi:cyclic-di-GMP-binding protein